MISCRIFRNGAASHLLQRKSTILHRRSKYNQISTTLYQNYQVISLSAQACSLLPPSPATFTASKKIFQNIGLKFESSTNFPLSRKSRTDQQKSSKTKFVILFQKANFYNFNDSVAIVFRRYQVFTLKTTKISQISRSPVCISNYLIEVLKIRLLRQIELIKKKEVSTSSRYCHLGSLGKAWLSRIYDSSTG